MKHNIITIFTFFCMALITNAIFDRIDRSIKLSVSYGEQYTPPEWVDTAYITLSKCIGKNIRISLNDIEWRIGADTFPRVLLGYNSNIEASLVVGLADTRNKIIYLRRQPYYMGDIIRHELTHMILVTNPFHPAWAFNTQCNNIL